MCFLHSPLLPVTGLEGGLYIVKQRLRQVAMYRSSAFIDVHHGEQLWRQSHGIDALLCGSTALRRASHYRARHASGRIDSRCSDSGVARRNSDWRLVAGFPAYAVSLRLIGRKHLMESSIEDVPHPDVDLGAERGTERGTRIEAEACRSMGGAAPTSSGELRSAGFARSTRARRISARYTPVTAAGIASRYSANWR